jgi:hypothetical protein
VASCTYFRYGKGGRQEALQALCILALNIVIGRTVAGANRPKFQLPGSKMIDCCNRIAIFALKYSFKFEK